MTLKGLDRLHHRLAAALDPDQAVMDEVGVEGVEHIVERIIDPGRRRALRPPEMIEIRAVGHRRRVEGRVPGQTHENGAVQFRHGHGLGAQLRQGVAGTTGHLDTTAVAAKAPTVIGANQVPVLDPTLRQRVVAVRAAIAKGVDAGFRSPQHDGLARDLATQRLAQYLTRQCHGQPSRFKVGGQGHWVAAFINCGSSACSRAAVAR